jgi:hypothetical protein
MHDEERGPTPLLFIDKTRFIVSGYVNSQKTSSWCAENARQIQEVTLHEQVHVCHASSANQWRVLVPVFPQTTNSHRCYTHSNTILCTRVTMRKTMLVFSKPLQHLTPHNYTHSLQNVFGDETNRTSWCHCFWHLNLRSWLNLWGFLKDKVYSSNPHSDEDLKRSISNAVSSISPAEFQRVC